MIEKKLNFYDELHLGILKKIYILLNLSKLPNTPGVPLKRFTNSGL